MKNNPPVAAGSFGQKATAEAAYSGRASIYQPAFAHRPPMPNWYDLSYLLHGTARQRHTHAVLQRLALWPTLHAFGPVLTGTIPLDIDLPGSDADVVCGVLPAARPAFVALVRKHYGHLPGFQLTERRIGALDSVVASFTVDNLVIEVFGQALPATQQQAYRHMVVEHAVLEIGGEPWRRAVRALKQQGLKTEPAFAALLGLPGDPYAALLTLEQVSVEELAALVARCALPADLV
jgi:hypothetical protein